MSALRLNYTPDSSDMIQYASDSSSESDGEGSIMRQLTSAAESDSADKKASWMKRLTRSGKRDTYRLSIQSGDIVLPSSPVSPVSTGASFSPASPSGREEVVGSLQAPSPPTDGTVASSATVVSSSPPAPHKSRGGLYGRIFNFVQLYVQKAFYSSKIGRVNCPVVSIGMLVLNLLILSIIVAIAATRFPPRININIKESFGIPNHPAQIHWDAFEAAKEGQFDNTSQLSDLAPVSTNQELRKRRNALQPRSVTSEDCQSSNTQYALHINWEMDLVFRVPASNSDKNILRQDRISYIHEIEERIYTSSEYKNFCHKRRGSNLCDPLNSLLTWLYPRDPNTGLYIYDTPDGFTPDLPGTVRSLSANLSVALWFTGGAINFVNTTDIEAKILRSQIRVGLPLPCFTGTHDRREEQKQKVTNYFVSLGPILEQLSTR